MPAIKIKKTKITKKQLACQIVTQDGTLKPISELSILELQLALVDSISILDAQDKRIIQAYAILGECLP